MGKISLLISALYHGKELANKETWKNASALAAAFGVILKIAEMFLPGFVIDDETTKTIIDGLVSLSLAVNGYTQVASSTTVGIPTKE